MVLKTEKLSVTFDIGRASVTSVIINGGEWVAGELPLFRFCLRDKGGEALTVSAFDAKSREETENGAVYSGFEGIPARVTVSLTDEGGDAAWRIAVDPNTDELCAEWVDFPLVCLPPLAENGGDGEILYPYNEGALVRNIKTREESSFCHREPEYPSKGSYSVFPNMICSQMLAYLRGDCGLYMGAHDKSRGVKGVDFYPAEGGVAMEFRLYCGVDFGETYNPDFPVVWAAVGGAWESAAERYRLWLESALPENVKKIKENPRLPEWYKDSPLVLTYPVRGTHDTDEMKPNRMYPYVNVLPTVERISELTKSKLMVLLMHWEGTAPWAPPYVWPPFGGEEGFFELRDRLHERGDLLGVYCSGFGYTLKSNLIDGYDKTEECAERGLGAAMCAAPNGEVQISNICRSQRSGYDICPASVAGEKLLMEAYAPLFESGIDYSQILDQNHGGGQYFCYSRDHGHPPVPGAWMTEKMQKMLESWQDSAKNMLFGCESAAAEAFMGNLLFSDNRFELNYHIGRPVPLYAYLYHEYLRNFMGNQVSNPAVCDDNADSLAYRIAYSFSAGDSLTLILNQDGGVMSHWGKVKDEERVSDNGRILRFVASLCEFYREKGEYLFDGRMIGAEPVECESFEFRHRKTGQPILVPAIHTSAWLKKDGERVQLLINPFTRDISCRVGGRELTVPAEGVLEIRI